MSLHGQYPKRTKEKDVDQDKTLLGSGPHTPTKFFWEYPPGHEPATVTETNSDYTLGHANPNRQRDKSKQTRHSGERQEGKNLSAYRYFDPHRKEHLLENNGKTHKVQRS